MTFRKELESLINRHSVDNELSTPDYILADYTFRGRSLSATRGRPGSSVDSRQVVRVWRR